MGGSSGRKRGGAEGRSWRRSRDAQRVGHRYSDVTEHIDSAWSRRPRLPTPTNANRSNSSFLGWFSSWASRWVALLCSALRWQSDGRCKVQLHWAAPRLTWRLFLGVFHPLNSPYHFRINYGAAAGAIVIGGHYHLHFFRQQLNALRKMRCLLAWFSAINLPNAAVHSVYWVRWSSPGSMSRLWTLEPLTEIAPIGSSNAN